MKLVLSLSLLMLSAVSFQIHGANPGLPENAESDKYASQGWSCIIGYTQTNKGECKKAAEMMTATEIQSAYKRGQDIDTNMRLPENAELDKYASQGWSCIIGYTQNNKGECTKQTYKPSDTEYKSTYGHDQEARNLLLSDIKRRCIDYGATPGTSEYFNCIRAIDENEHKKAEIEMLINKQCNNTGNFLEGLNLAIRGGNLNEPRDRCRQRIERTMRGIGSNDRECFKRGTSIICRDY